MNKAVLFWSSGKDSAYALHQCRRLAGLDVVALVTTVNRPDEVVAVHRVPEALVDAQARACGLTLIKIPLPAVCSNSEYAEAVGPVMRHLSARGVTQVLFGDLFLEDIRGYRQALMEPLGMEPVFPLWGRDTRRVAGDMLATGLKAVVVCVDTEQLDAEFVGRQFDAALLRALPEGVDPCGENGEFHTFAYAGPMFDSALAVRVNTTGMQGRFAYADLSLAKSDRRSEA